MSYRPEQLAQYAFSQELSLVNNASIQSGWIDMEGVDKYQFEARGAGDLGFSQVIESSSSPSGAGSTVNSVTPTTDVFRLFNVTARQRYMRFTWTNVSGATVPDAYMAIKLTYGSSDKLSVTPLSNQPSDFSQAALVRAVVSGQQPDGDYVNAKQDGSAWTTTAPLAVGATYVSPWTDTDGWNTIEIVINSNVISQYLGVIVEFTDDTQAGSPVIRDSRKFSFKASDILNGSLKLNVSPVLDGFRVRYINGSTIQASFFMDATLKTNSSNQRFSKAGALWTGDFLTEVALGSVDLYRITTFAGRVSGLSAGSGVADVWGGGGTYTGQPVSFTPEMVAVLSGSASDTAVGTGARTVRITGLRSSTSRLIETEVITLNGGTPAMSALTWWRVWSATVVTAGSTNSNVGVITIRAAVTTANVFCTIQPTYNSSTTSAITIPFGSTGLLKRVRMGMVRSNGSAGSGTLTLRIRPPGGVLESRRVFELQTGGDKSFELLGGIPIIAGSDIRFRVQAVSDTGTVVEAAAEMVLLEES